MNAKGIQPACLLIAAVVSALPFSASATSEVNPFRLIAHKNPFRLQPADKLSIEAPRASARIALQGLTTVLGRRQALIRLVLPGSVSEVSVMLGEGERAGCVEVLQIDNLARTVRALNSGSMQELSLEAVPVVAPMPARQ